MKALLVFLLAGAVAGSALAQTKPINLSLTPDIAVYDQHTRIEGLTLSVWGENEQESLALGLATGTTGKSVGASVGILNYGDSYKGLQWGVVNNTTRDFIGWQGGPFFGLLGSLVNYTDGHVTGLQIGVFNYAGFLSGLQLGVVNYAKAADAGVQIGLVNIIPANRWFSAFPNELAPGMILVNWRFGTRK